MKKLNPVFWLRVGALILASAIMLGAFGAHALKKYADATTLHSYSTGVSYQIYHGLALFIVLFFRSYIEKKYIALCLKFFAFGILLFSGSIYALTFIKIINNSILPQHFIVTFIAVLTPLGGLLFIAGWLFLFISTFLKPKS